MVDEAPKPATGQVLGLTVPASVERGVRTVGNILLMAVLGAAPQVGAAITAVIPAEYLPVVAGASALVMKQLRLSFPTGIIGTILKNLPL